MSKKCKLVVLLINFVFIMMCYSLIDKNNDDNYFALGDDGVSVVSSSASSKKIDYSRPIKPTDDNVNVKLHEVRTLKVLPNSLFEKRDVKLQNFAISNIGEENEITWYSYCKTFDIAYTYGRKAYYSKTNKKRLDDNASYVVAYNKKGSRVFAARLTNSGHGQSFTVHNSRTEGKYDLYVGAQLPANTLKKAVDPKDSQSTVMIRVTPGSKYEINKKDNVAQKNLSGDGYFIRKKNSKYLSSEFAYDEVNKQVAVKTNRVVKFYDIRNDVVFKNQTALKGKLLSKYKKLYAGSINIPRDTSIDKVSNGSDYTNGYYYYLYGYKAPGDSKNELSGAHIVCIKNDGTVAWNVKLNLKEKIKKLRSYSGNWEAEGIKVYKISSSKFRIYIGYRMGSYTHSGIVYFDLDAA